MTYKALKSFVGTVNAKKGEIKEIPDDLAANLLKVGYIEAVGSVKVEKIKTETKLETERTTDKGAPAVKRGRKSKKTEAET